MPHDVTTTVYTFAELDDSAKKRARAWYRDGALDYEWWDCVYEDADQIAKILGIELDRKPVPLVNKTVRHDPCIFFSGFASQGDGACFEGSYLYAKGAAKAIREHAPQDATLYAIADNLQDIQRRHFYRLTARVKQRGRYYHEYCTEIDVCSSETGNDVDADTADAICTELRAFMRWIYRQLETEHDYQLSDESVDATIEANEYEFDEDGNRA
jgi:hypothetical protein